MTPEEQDTMNRCIRSCAKHGWSLEAIAKRYGMTVREVAKIISK